MVPHLPMVVWEQPMWEAAHASSQPAAQPTSAHHCSKDFLEGAVSPPSGLKAFNTELLFLLRFVNTLEGTYSTVCQLRN